MILRSVLCDVKGCDEQYTEQHFNQGFKGWGHIAGLEDENGHNRVAYICPKHLQKAKELLNGNLD
jgi:hypothetical protein